MTHNNKRINEAPIWQQLSSLAASSYQKNLIEYFANDDKRTENYRLYAAGLTADFSRHFIDGTILDKLLELANQQKLPQQISNLFSGKAINYTENRAALHTALRGSNGSEKIQQEIQLCLQKMQDISSRLKNHQWLGFNEKPITDIVHIGIGGSDLGPRMAVTALQTYKNQAINVHFVSNIDPNDIEETLKQLNPETTLFTIASKSWTTLETLSNADTAKAWLRKAANGADISQHFIAISSKPERCADYGINPNNILPMWDWVGGRYSLWSAIGLPIILATSFEYFSELLEGAKTMDEHFATTAFESNMPVLMALLEVWYVNFWGCGSQAILPYDHQLRLFPDHLQQLIMESNGKRVNSLGQTVDYQTCPVIWGAAGTNGQHSFHQLLHQGTQLIPVDFILPLTSHSSNHDQHRHLVANCLAQAEALMDGSKTPDVNTLSTQEKELLPHKTVPGNKPSTIISMQKLTPSTLGALIALYEHKVFCSSCIWDINAFDQWGVELGKSISLDIYNALSSCNKNIITNPATAASVAAYQEAQKNH